MDITLRGISITECGSIDLVAGGKKVGKLYVPENLLEGVEVRGYLFDPDHGLDALSLQINFDLTQDVPDCK